jgi:hypothetical protein
MKKILARVLATLLVVALLITVPGASAAEQPSTTAPEGSSAVGEQRALQFVPGGIPVLVLQSEYPWGKSAYLSIMSSLGYAPIVADWAAIGTTVHLEDFSYVYIPSVQQSNSFYTNYAARMSEIAAWVAGGGRLLFSFCTQGQGFALPGGAVQVHGTAPNNGIVDAGHPIVTGTLSDGIALTNANLLGNSCSHNYLTVLPESAHVILEYSGHGPTLAEYDYGSGHIIASGLTWEFYVAPYGSLSGTGAFAVRAYDDLLLYSFPKAMHTITATAGAGGTISPSGSVSVVQGSSKSFTITANPGNAISSVIVDGMAVALASRSTMAYTFIGVNTDHTISASFMSSDVMAPVIELPDGVPQSAVGSPYDLHLVATDDTSIADVGIFENGQRVGGSSTGGDIRVRLTLPDGRHELVIVAVDGVGNRTERAITLVVDTRPPVLTIDPPSSVSTATFTLTGSAVDAVSGLASLTINNESIIPFLDGSFSVKLALVKGANEFVIEAADRAGNIASQTFTITYRAASSVPSSIYVVLTIGSADMEVNGMTRKMDAAPFIKDGRTLLPIRALIEALGGSIQWNASTKTATVTLGGRTVALTIGSKTALIDGKPVALDVAPMIVKGRTFLPLRAVAENLGLDLAWEPVSRTVSLTYWP